MIISYGRLYYTSFYKAVNNILKLKFAWISFWQQTSFFTSTVPKIKYSSYSHSLRSHEKVLLAFCDLAQTPNTKWKNKHLHSAEVKRFQCFNKVVLWLTTNSGLGPFNFRFWVYIRRIKTPAAEWSTVHGFSHYFV